MKKGLTILIVDDNVNFINRMMGLLEELKNIDSIVMASDYDAAILLLSDKIPDFVLLDINLPGKNGIEILKTIRQQKRPCEVIMITNHANEYYRNQCRGLGAGYFLDKSSEFGMVTEIIENKYIINEV